MLDLEPCPATCRCPEGRRQHAVERSVDILILSRLQFPATISFHDLYPPLRIGLGVSLVSVESLRPGPEIPGSVLIWPVGPSGSPRKRPLAKSFGVRGGSAWTRGSASLPLKSGHCQNLFGFDPRAQTGLLW